MYFIWFFCTLFGSFVLYLALYTLPLLEADVRAAVLCTALAGGVVGYRLQLTLRLAMDLAGGHAFLHHVVPQRLRTLHTEVAQVLLRVTGVVGMTGDDNLHRRVLYHELTEFGNRSLVLFANIRFETAIFEIDIKV